MSKSNKKTNWKKTIDLHIWAAKTWWKMEPKLFVGTGLEAFMQGISPYLNVWFSAQIINELVGNRDWQMLWKWILLTVGVNGGLYLAHQAIHHWSEAIHALEWDYEDKLQADKMMEMDFAAVESPLTQELRYAMRKHQLGNVYGFNKIQNWYFEKMVGGIVSIGGATLLTVSLFIQKVPVSADKFIWLNHPMANVGMIGIMVGGVLLAPILSGKSSAEHAKSWKYNNAYNRCLETFGSLANKRYRNVDIRMYNQQDMAQDAMDKAFPVGKNGPVTKIIYGGFGLYSAASTAVSTLLMGVVYVFVCLKAWAGAFGIGYVTQYVGAITNLCRGITDLFLAVADMPSNANYLRDIRKFMEIPNDMYQGSLTTEKRSDRQYQVEFKDVSFKYPGSENYALRHVNMKFKVGSRLAVVGMNGSGKTTFIKLLCRLYDPTEGEILLNGINIRKYKYDDYMDLFSVVFQDFQLVSLSLGQNVAASAIYDEERVQECLRKAGFGERLATMERGLNTYLYKDLDKAGVDVSGGEAQKIALARTLYKDAPFLILDEPTAALDPIAEADIYSRFNDIAGDRTAIYISHRLSSCKFCDEIAVFHEGSVIEQGTHEMLVANKDSKYYELWNAQAQYYA